MLHTVHQGVAVHVLAGLITHHYEELHPTITIAQLSEMLSGEAWAHYKRWCKGKSVVSRTSSTFTGLRFGRENWQSYPELASCYKGAMVKYLMFWAADFLKEKSAAIGSNLSRLREYCAWSFARFQYLQETNGPWLSDETAEEMCNIGRTFLLFYQQLASESRAANPDRKMYKLVPKFHCLLHLCLFTRATGRNPRYDHLYMEEDFMKHVARICSRCHPATMDTVSLCRYRALIELAKPGAHRAHH
eukprot:Skav225051  [mRNA]  locus=scaffold1570:218183:218920:+ [translate_table: standard]